MHLENLPFNYEEAVAVLLFVIGFCMLLFSRNLIKKVIGLDIMDSGVFLLLADRGYIAGRVLIILLMRKSAMKCGRWRMRYRLTSPIRGSGCVFAPWERLCAVAA